MIKTFADGNYTNYSDYNCSKKSYLLTMIQKKSLLIDTAYERQKKHFF